MPGPWDTLLFQQKVDGYSPKIVFWKWVIQVGGFLKIWKNNTKLNPQKHGDFSYEMKGCHHPFWGDCMWSLSQRMVDLSVACQPYLEPRYVVVLSLGGSGRGSCWSLAIHHVSMQHFQTPSFGYLAIFLGAQQLYWARGSTWGSTGDGNLFFWSGCEVGVNTCWWRMRELLVNTSPQILSLSLKIWILCMPVTMADVIFLTVGHLLLVLSGLSHPFTILVFGGSWESFWWCFHRLGGLSQQPT